MDGLGRSVGAGSSVRLAGKTYLMEPLTLRSLGRIENRIIGDRIYPIEQLHRMANFVSDQEELLRRIDEELVRMRKDKQGRVVTAEDLQDYLVSFDGIVYSAWLCLRPNHPDVFNTYEDALEIFSRVEDYEREDFVRHRDIVSGLHLVATLDFPDESMRSERRRQNRKRREPERVNSVLPWRMIVRKLAEARYFSHSDIQDMTLYELNVHTMDEDDLGRVRRMGAGEAAKFSKKPIIRIGPGGKGLKELQAAQAEGRRRLQDNRESEE